MDDRLLVVVLFDRKLCGFVLFPRRLRNRCKLCVYDRGGGERGTSFWLEKYLYVCDPRSSAKPHGIAEIAAAWSINNDCLLDTLKIVIAFDLNRVTAGDEILKNKCTCAVRKYRKIVRRKIDKPDLQASNLTAPAV